MLVNYYINSDGHVDFLLVKNTTGSLFSKFEIFTDIRLRVYRQRRTDRWADTVVTHDVTSYGSQSQCLLLTPVIHSLKYAWHFVFVCNFDEIMLTDFQKFFHCWS